MLINPSSNTFNTLRFVLTVSGMTFIAAAQRAHIVRKISYFTKEPNGQIAENSVQNFETPPAHWFVVNVHCSFSETNKVLNALAALSHMGNFFLFLFC